MGNGFRAWGCLENTNYLTALEECWLRRSPGRERTPPWHRERPELMFLIHADGFLSEACVPTMSLGSLGSEPAPGSPDKPGSATSRLYPKQRDKSQQRGCGEGAELQSAYCSRRESEFGSSTHMRQLTTACHSSSRGSNVFFQPPWQLHAYSAQCT